MYFLDLKYLVLKERQEMITMMDLQRLMFLDNELFEVQWGKNGNGNIGGYDLRIELVREKDKSEELEFEEEKEKEEVQE